MALPYIISKLSLKEKTPSLNLMFSPFIAPNCYIILSGS